MAKIIDYNIIGFDESFKLCVNEYDKSVVPNILQNKYYEPHIQNLLNLFISPLDCCVDIGANFGQHTVAMSLLANKVVSIEASPNNFINLKETIELNKLNNVIPINRGVFNKKGKLTFSHKEENAACSFFSDTGFRQGNEDILDVEIGALSYILEDNEVFWDRIDFMKIDIEGSELFALQGMEDILKEQSPKILIELNKYTCQNFFNYHPFKIVKYLNSLDYNKVAVVSESSKINLLNINQFQSWLLTDKSPIIVDAFFKRVNNG